MRIAALVLGAAGLLVAVTEPVVGLPEGFPLLLLGALTLWLGGLATAAACVAPPRRAAGLAALGIAGSAWLVVLVFRLAPLWGGLALALAAVMWVRGRAVATSAPHVERSGDGTRRATEPAEAE